MGAIEIIALAVNLMNIAFGAAKSAQVVGNQDWAKYADAGITIANRLTSILPDVFANPAKYDGMEPAAILALLQPASWEDLEARARVELGLPPTA